MRYVLEGSVQKANDQVRIVVQLIEATTGGHLWSQRYDRPLKAIFALQDEIVQKIVTTLKLQLSLQEQGILVANTRTTWRPMIPLAWDRVRLSLYSRDQCPGAAAVRESPCLGPAVCRGVRVAGLDLLAGVVFRWSVDP